MEISYDTIPIPQSILPFYGSYYVSEGKDGPEIYGRNRFDGGIDVINISTRAYRKVPVVKEGPNAVDNIDMFKVKDQQLFTKGLGANFYRLDLGSGKGKRIHRVPAENLGEYQLHKRFNLSQFRTLALSPDKTKIVYHTFHSDYIRQKVQNIYKANVYTAILVDLKLQTSKLLQIPYPEEYYQLQDATFGDQDIMTFDFINNETLVVGFQNVPELRMISMKDLSVQNLFKPEEGEYPFTAPISNGNLNMREKRKLHLFNQPLYRQVRFHPEKKRIYRCYKDKTNSPGDFDFSQNYLLILGSDLEVRHNLKLPENIYPLLHPYKNGLLGLATNKESEDYLIVAKIAFIENQ